MSSNPRNYMDYRGENH